MLQKILPRFLIAWEAEKLHWYPSQLSRFLFKGSISKSKTRNIGLLLTSVSPFVLSRFRYLLDRWNRLDAANRSMESQFWQCSWLKFILIIKISKKLILARVALSRDLTKIQKAYKQSSMSKTFQSSSANYRSGWILYQNWMSRVLPSIRSKTKSYKPLRPIKQYL